MMVDADSVLSNKRITIKLLEKLNILNDVMAATAIISHLNPTPKQRILFISQKIESIPLCECGNPLKMNWDKTKSNIFNAFCSGKCMSNSPKTQDKISKTHLDRYGKRNNNPNKRKATCLEKYGKEYISQVNHIHKKQVSSISKAKQCHWNEYTKSVLSSKEKFSDLLKETKNPVVVAKILKVNHSTILSYCEKYDLTNDYIGNCSRSKQEIEVFDYLSSITDLDIIQNNRTLLSPQEVDLFIPEKNIAIEFNGVYWHCQQQGKERNYHVKKTNACESVGVRLYQIWSNEWENKQSIWKSVLSNALGQSKRIGARKCSIQIIRQDHSALFLEQNHLQGKCASGISVGLFYRGDLVSVMTFGKSRFSKTSDWELIRFCNAKGISVVGGASRLLAHFRKNHSGSIISYANRRWSDGGLYKALGFTMSHVAAPNYFYTIDFQSLHSRNKFQKHKLEKQLKVFDKDKSEYENMLANEYDRIWDCGNLVFILE